MLIVIYVFNNFQLPTLIFALDNQLQNGGRKILLQKLYKCIENKTL